jgi:hypothetical protein
MPLSILYCTSEFYGSPAVAFVTARFPPAFPSAVFVVIAVGSSRAIPVLIPWCLRTSACSNHAGTLTFSLRGRALDEGTAPLAFPAEIPGQSVPILEACPPAVNSFVQFARRVFARAASWATIMSVKGEYVGSPATPYGYFCPSTAAIGCGNSPKTWSMVLDRWNPMRKRLRTGEKSVSGVLEGTSETPLCDAVTFSSESVQDPWMSP